MMRDWEDRQSAEREPSFGIAALAFLSVLPFFGWIDDLFQAVKGIL